jgi:hypothetical protein
MSPALQKTKQFTVKLLLISNKNVTTFSYLGYFVANNSKHS